MAGIVIPGRTKNPNPDLILAIDPGDVHVGWACGLRVKDTQWGVKAGEWTRSEAIAEVTRFGKDLDELIIEKFVLYPGKAAQQSYSPMLTSELIGKLKLVAELNNVTVTMQGADIKVPTKSQLKARGIPLVGKGNHAKDAEAHLYYRLLKEYSAQQ